MWWQYLIVAALIGAAVFYLARHMRRSLDPNAAPACGCGCTDGCRSKNGGEPQPLSDLDAGACANCAAGDRPRP